MEIIEKMFAPEPVTSNHLARVTRSGNTFYVLLNKPLSPEVVTWIASEFLPERLYIPFLGYSVDMIHEVWDIIVPNAFLEYSNTLASVEIGKDNRDHFVERKMFIENFTEQKDYYVEDFWLSLWWIVVSWSPIEPSPEMQEKLLLAYEADAYVASDIFPALETLTSDEIPTILLAWVISGKKHSKYGEIEGAELVIKNILTTINLLEDASLEDEE